MACSCKIAHDDAIRLAVSENDVYYIQRYLFLKESLKDLVIQFTSDSPFKIDDERYKMLVQEYVDSSISYNIAFQSIVNKYLNDELVKDKKYETLIDFKTNELVINIL